MANVILLTMTDGERAKVLVLTFEGVIRATYDVDKVALGISADASPELGEIRGLRNGQIIAAGNY